MESIYGDNSIKYSHLTPALASTYPSWTEIYKNKESIGQQLLNVFALELENIEELLDNLLKNQFIGTANIGEIYEVFKFVVDDSITQNVTIDGIYDSLGNSIKEVETLREFYSSAENAAIFDFDKSICYIRNPCDSVTISFNGTSKTYDKIVSHHIWNVFDEFALLLGLRRRHYKDGLENNAQLKERILNVFRFPSNSTEVGLVNGIGQSLGLVHAMNWEEYLPGAEDNNLTLDHKGIYTETVNIDGRSIHKSQFLINEEDKTVTLQPKLDVLFRDDISYKTENIRKTNQGIELASNKKDGYLITDVIEAPSLKEWKSLDIDFSGTVKIEIYPYNYQDFINVEESIILSTMVDSPTIDLSSLQISIPIVIKVYLYRDKQDDSSAIIKDMSIKYFNRKTEVRYIHSIKINAMYDKDYRRTLFDEEGFPQKDMERFVQELSKVSPILWDKFKWDESYWDVVEENLMGLEALPHRWDPDLSDIPRSYFQSGIGDSRDLLVKTDPESWAIGIHSGFYYDGDPLKSNYLFSSPKEEYFAGPVTEITLSGIPQHGSPIVIKSGNTYLTQVSFLDHLNNFSITNVENLEYKESGEYHLLYSDAVIQEIVGYQGSIEYTEKNSFKIDSSFGKENGITVKYSIKNSFVVQRSATSCNIILSDAFQDISVFYDPVGAGLYHLVDESILTTDPTINHIKQYFVYKASSVETPSRLVVKVSPDILVGNGYDLSLIIVDVLDKHGNPVTGCTVEANILSPLTENQGTITKTGENYNRHIFRYHATQVTEGVEVQIEFTASLEGSADVSETVSISVVALEG